MKLTRIFSACWIFVCCLTAHGQVSGGKLPTRWDKDVSPTHPLGEYPRPQMVRAKWESLNGPWDYALTDSAATTQPSSFDGKILVPYPYESSLSGVSKPSIPDQRLWYRRSFAIPPDWAGQRVLLHFGAVNWEAVVSVNGAELGTHKGGYDPFDFDITDVAKSGENEIVVAVRNTLVSDSPEAHVLGKQRIRPVSVLYTGATGIWQTVWLEPVPKAHIADIKITPDVDTGVLLVTTNTGAPASSLTVTVSDAGKTIATATGTSGSEMKLPISQPHLWTPEDPLLYSIHISLAGSGGDAIDSYAALRKIALGKDDRGRTCVFLNNKYLFQVGALDQGYWPDGIYTAPTDEALKYDIVMAKQLGFNLLRKHAKVEPDRWYYWTDKLGMLVWQDMPQAFGDNFTETTKQQWLTEMKQLIATHSNHPSIIMWTLFNEGWGQHDTAEITQLAKQLDPTRLVNSASGGYNQMVDGKMSQYRLPTPPDIGDINDTHVYPDPGTEKQDDTRALVCGEFGGISMRVKGHDWSEGNFGYGTVMHDGWHLSRRYQQVLKEGWALRESSGASALVYTQIVDVENETNGMMTYDRAVIKPIANLVMAANHGEFPPLPPAPVNHDLVATSEEAPQTWAYTTEKPRDDWTKSEFDSTSWKTGPAPFGQGYPVRTAWTDTPGDIWLRRTVTLPAEIPQKLNVLTKHDEDVEVYVNGVLAASAAGYTDDYAAIAMSNEARAAMKPGANVIAVHCHQTVGGQVIDVGIVAAK